MKTPIFSLIILLLAIFAARAQVLPFNATEFCEVVNVAHDDSGNVFYGGGVGGTIDFEPSDGQDAQDTITTETDSFAGFIASYSPAGEFRYVLRFDSAGPSDLATDAAGNLYVVGQLLGPVDFDPGPGVEVRTGDEDVDGFLASYTNTGDFRFAELLGGTGFIFDLSVATSAADRVVVSGMFEGQIDLDPSAATNILTASGFDDGFLAGFSKSGTYVFGEQLAGESLLASGVAADATGNAYVCGEFNETANFDGSILTSAGNQDMFFVSYSPVGALRFAHRFGGGSTDRAIDVATDNSGSIYLTGSVGPGTDFDPGAGVVNSPTLSSYFMARYTSAGALNYAVVSPSGFPRVRAIAARNGKVFTTGSFSRFADLAPGDPQERGVVTSEGDAVFVASYNAADGTPNYARSFGNPETNSGDVSATLDGSVAVVGTFEGEVDFDPGAGVVSSTSVGIPDSFSLGLDPQGLLPGTSAPRFDVTNTDDSGAGSLRAAIEAANSTAARDTITFAIPGAGPHVITPVSPLPVISASVVIDGLSQPGASAATWPPDLRVIIDGSAAGAGANGLSLDGAFVTPTSLRGLVVNGFDAYGIALSPAANDLEVTNCFIGTDPSGTAAVPNRLGGLFVEANDVHVGLPGAGNLISGNGGPGILLMGGDIFTAQGNFIGTTADGSGALGNGDDGVVITASLGDTTGPTDSNLIGGVRPGEGNRIAHNAGDGVALGLTTRSDVLRNSIYDNGGLGIDFFRTRVNPLVGTPDTNDVTDAGDGEPNRSINHPVLRSVISVGGETHVDGVFDGSPGQSFVIEFFSSPDIDPSGHGEGKDFLGAIDVDTSNGLAKFSTTLPFVDPGQFISATVTNRRIGIGSEEGTSQFSVALPVRFPTVTSLADSGAGSLRAAIEAANASAGADTIYFAPAMAGAYLELSSDLPTITDSITLVGTSGFVLSGGQNGRPLTIDADGSTVVISDLTITGGSATTGGGILVTNGSVELNRCVIRGCSATGDGGGIAVSGGLLFLNDCQITACAAGGDGGGIVQTGGIFNANRVTFDNNTADGRGGGIYSNRGSSGRMDLRNGTFSRNSASTGGGIFSVGSFDSSSVRFCTLVMNEASDSGGGFSGDIDVAFSIISLNTAPVDPDFANPDPQERNKNFIGGDPVIGPLRDNGGFVPTHALLSSSPVRDIIDGFAPGTDARLAPRRNLQSVRLDYGAFEFFTTGEPVEAARTYAGFVIQSGAGGPEEDDNGDGLSNFAARFFGIAVISGGAGSVTELTREGDTSVLSFSSPFTVLGAVSSSEVGSDLGTWSPGPEPVEVGSSTARLFYEVRLPRSSLRNFVRIRVSPEP